MEYDMDQVAGNPFLKGARDIADSLIAKSRLDDSGRYWETLEPDIEGVPHWKVREDLYGGNSGIALFLAELYRQTREKPYLTAALETMGRVAAQFRSHPPPSYAFHTGRMGMVFAMLRVGQISGEKACREAAISICKSCTRDVETAFASCDLFHGYSGALLGFLHLYAAFRSPWVLPPIGKLLQVLIEKAHLGPKGIYWDRSGKNIAGLCGFSHGAAGIGFVLLELGRFFQNPAIVWLASQAFEYETCRFDAERGEWPDFRKGLYADEGQCRQFRQGNEAFFKEPSFMTAWCHGAAGIGLSRLEAYKATGTSRYLDQLQRALQAVKRCLDIENGKADEETHFTLCHGSCGLMSLFLAASQELDHPPWMAQARSLGIRVLHHWKSGGAFRVGYRLNSETVLEDPGLFVGHAGVGYFLLRLAAPNTVPCILAPGLRNLAVYEGREEPPELGTSPTVLRRAMVAKAYERSLTLLEEYLPQKTMDFLGDLKTEEDLKARYHQIVAEAMRVLPPDRKKRVAAVFALESRKTLIEDQTPSHALLRVKHVVAAQRAMVLGQRDLPSWMKTRLILDRDLHLLECPGDLNGEGQRVPLYILLWPTDVTLVEKTLSAFCYAVLTVFKKKSTVKQAVSEMVLTMAPEIRVERMRIEKLVIDQIKEAVRACLLVKAE